MPEEICVIVVSISPPRGSFISCLVTYSSRRGLHSYAASRLEMQLPFHSCENN
jgi:hypothetical protein